MAFSMRGNAELSALLKSKVQFPPPRKNLVGRPRLLARLNDAVVCPLTLISAPAGSGKSTLISGWVQLEAGRRFAWLELDSDDRDLARFLSYVILALQPIQPGIGKAALSMLGSLQTPPPDVVITALLNEIAEFPEPVIL